MMCCPILIKKIGGGGKVILQDLTPNITPRY